MAGRRAVALTLGTPGGAALTEPEDRLPRAARLGPIRALDTEWLHVSSAVSSVSPVRAGDGRVDRVARGWREHRAMGVGVPDQEQSDQGGASAGARH